MGDHDAFGPAGRPGRIHHVSEVIRLQARVERFPPPSLDRRPIGVEPHDAAGERRQRLLDGLEGHEHLDPRVLEHEGEPLRRVRGIEGDVRASGLEHSEESDSHFRRPGHAQADQNVGSDAELPQMFRELVRLAIELRVGQRLPFVLDCDRVRSPGGLALEEPREGVGRSSGRGSVPFVEEQAALGLRDERQAGNGPVRIRNGGFEEHFQVRGHAGHRRLVEEIGRILEDEQEPLLLVDGEQSQIELRARVGELHRRHSKSFELQSRPRRVVQLEHHLEDRRVREVPVRPQLLHELLERKVLVRVRLERGFADTLEKTRETSDRTRDPSA